MTDNLFKKFVINTYFLKKSKFVEIVPEFLSNYSKWSSRFYDLNEVTPVTDEIIKMIGEDLLDMRYNQEDMIMFFHHAGFDFNKILEQTDQKLDQQFSSHPNTSTKIERSPDNRKVFIVHGHNDDLKKEVEEYLRTIQVEPIILHKQADLGKTIIEKVEHYSDVGFAVIILTKDDVGGNPPFENYEVLKKHYSNPDPIETLSRKDRQFITNESTKLIMEILLGLKPRARQNVIFEFGYFIARLGRGRVAALCEDNIDRPSDIDGLLYTSLDKLGEWKKKLAKEIDAAGIKIDTRYL
jgi:predicted nucleotide-binding protein